jgi:hypothetical protein
VEAFGVGAFKFCSGESGSGRGDNVRRGDSGDSFATLLNEGSLVSLFGCFRW